MNEIEKIKLYQNAGIETNKYKLCCTGCKHIAKLEVINGYPLKWICDKYDEVSDCDKAEPDYPQFTAEKQVKLIKWLVCTGEEISISGHRKGNLYWMSTNVDNKEQASTFEETLARLINSLWQSLTEEEKQQVKGILE